MFNKTNNNNKNQINSLSIALFSIVLFLSNYTTYGSVKNNNNNEPIVITADSFTLDYNSGYAVYTDHVAVNQANRELKSDNLFIYFDKKTSEQQPQKTSKLKSLVATMHDINKNKPVVYLEKNLQDSNLISLFASAGTIKYEPGLNTNKLTLEKNAIIQQNNKKLMSELLYYDLKNEVAYMPKIKNQRSKIILG